MTRTRVKICGVCRPEDAQAAARAGADAIGLVFYPPAKRNVTADRARRILNALPPFVTPVGLFVDADADTVLRVSRDLGLRHVQLHGDEPPDLVAALPGLVVIKAIRVERDRFGATLALWRDAIRSTRLYNLRGFVLESPGPAPGGTGVANDWDTVIRHQRAGDFDGLPPVIAAGGLTPDTVAAVVRAVRPWAVDVSSGVEESLCVKSEERIRAFIGAVREGDSSPG